MKLSVHTVSSLARSKTTKSTFIGLAFHVYVVFLCKNLCRMLRLCEITCRVNRRKNAAVGEVSFSIVGVIGAAPPPGRAGQWRNAHL